MISTPEAIELAEAAADRFVATVDTLDEAELRAPARLDGWTRAFGAAHVAQALGAYVRLLRIAGTTDGTGEEHSGSAVYRRAVEETAAQPGPDLVRELRAEARQFLALARSLDAAAWQREVTSAGGWRHPARYTLLRCLRELETHHTDLGLGYESADWPSSYVRWALEDTLATLRADGFPLTAVEAPDLAARWELSARGPVVRGPSHLLLGWLAGRTPARELTADPLPVPPAWPQPPVHP
ncbi:maleylpyruvate isomerase family mycothiol-dependent enzyme [Streptomyces indicus]|uniref:Maleylpyruvate isomerase n=1 Tax=Streptomyces indicus TaxID=417292 RepID=A0A1G8ZNY8_9ACTN|nr:maleylpyruvate isomerase family mycothiol-dependent enzyme [Streptomyces indicus]SDK16832.1 maleylpyruvate isomerase [Streptomyces indicus]